MVMRKHDRLRKKQRKGVGVFLHLGIPRSDIKQAHFLSISTLGIYVYCSRLGSLAPACCPAVIMLSCRAVGLVD